MSTYNSILVLADGHTIEACIILKIICRVPYCDYKGPESAAQSSELLRILMHKTKPKLDRLEMWVVWGGALKARLGWTRRRDLSGQGAR